MNTKLKVTDQFGSISIDLTRPLDPQESAMLIQFATAIVSGKSILPLGVPGPSAAMTAQEYRVKFHDSGPNKIQAIKIVREFTGLGLREAKDVVEGTITCPTMTFEKVERLSEALMGYGIRGFVVESVPLVPLAV